MPRTLDPAAHAVRRDAFVDVAERLIRTKGYEQLSIQDVLDELGASKGAFYHYFGAKADLLEAVIERMADQALGEQAPRLADPRVPATAKLEGLFAGLARYKAERIDLTLALLTVWLSDDNAIVREKLRRIVVERLIPILTAIVEQGRAEGLAPVGSPADTARVVASLIQGAGDTATELFVARQAGHISYEAVVGTLDAYGAAYERLLGAPPGSLVLIDDDALRLWFDHAPEVATR